MFVLSKLKDLIEIPPNQFYKDFQSSLTDTLDLKYANKILPNVGLCLFTFEIEETEDPIVYPDSGSMHVRATFQMTVFSPQIGEILYGKIRSNSPEGLFITLGFFDSIMIPPAFMPANTRFDEQEQVWIWDVDGNDLYLDRDEEILFRVISVYYKELNPTPLKAEAENSSKVSPMNIIGSLNENGLGCLSWWENTE